MGHSRVPTPITRKVSSTAVASSAYAHISPQSLLESRVTTILAALRSQIEAGAGESSALLNDIAKQAQSLTEASGAAIALGQGDSVVCVGRSGETAPELGAHLSLNSGLSGECLRSNKPLRCDDTQIDMRVDAEVCLRLGLRSILAVPLHGESGQVGIVEAFSVYPFAFSDIHVKTLEDIARLIELAQKRRRPEPATESQEAMASFQPARSRVSVLEQTGIERLRRILATHEKPSRRIAGLALSAVVLVSAIAFRTWHKAAPAAQNVQASAIETAQPESPNPPSVTLDFSTKPSPITMAIAIGGRPRAARKPKVDNPDDSEADDVVVRNLSSDDNGVQPASLISDASTTEKPAQQAVDSGSVEPPQISSVHDRSADLQKLIPPLASPKLTPMVSQITRGTLQHRVEPQYPTQAQAMGLYGAVVLEATISEAGTVRNVKVVSGHPVLARAAVEAVKQWRYEPSLLNGKPVEVTAGITVRFSR